MNFTKKVQVGGDEIQITETNSQFTMKDSKMAQLVPHGKTPSLTLID